jgi:uncharacterized membrane-anchored protein
MERDMNAVGRRGERHRNDGWPRPAAAAVVSGLMALGVLSGMLVLHAWPLWTGEPIYLRVRPVDPRDLFRGDYVTLGYDVDTLRLRVPPEFRQVPITPPEPGTPAAPAWPEVDPIGDWWRPDSVTRGWTAAQHRRTVYLQLRAEASAVPGVPVIHVPVSISDRPVADATNLRGRIRLLRDDYVLTMDFGIDALFVREGTGRPIENAILDRGTPVYAEVAVAKSGAARVRALVVDGARVP